VALQVQQVRKFRLTAAHKYHVARIVPPYFPSQTWDERANPICPHHGTDHESGMDRKRVNSGSIRAIGFDERNRTLEIEFSDGRIVQYAGVSAEIHRRLISAPSIVSYFRDNVEESFTAKRIKG
jgi:KTSC domain